MKQRMRGLLAGIIAITLMFGTVTVFANTTRTIEVSFGNVRTTLFGEALVVRDAQGSVLEPFVYNNRVYVPLEVILHVMGTNAQWNPATGTLNFGGVETTSDAVPSAFFETVTYFERGGNHASRRLNLGTVNMLGVPFPNSLNMGMMGRTGIGQWEAWKSYNLNGQFTTLTGTIGRMDGTGQMANSISFIGDGITLASFVVDGDTLPTDISVNVRGVRILRIQFDESIRNAGIAFTNAMIE